MCCLGTTLVSFQLVLGLDAAFDNPVTNTTDCLPLFFGFDAIKEGDTFFGLSLVPVDDSCVHLLRDFAVLRMEANGGKIILGK